MDSQTQLRKLEKIADVPEPVGCYSHLVELPNGVVYIAGQKAWKIGKGTVVEGDISEQTRQIFKNVEGILAAAGLTLANVVRVQCCLADLNSYEEFEKVYSEKLGAHRPARVILGNIGLRGGALIELIVEAFRPTP
jgi:2-iminobutanoate/2-iminopropanoate deaminase